jgi:molybdenum cofactor cytidylyltransferase
MRLAVVILAAGASARMGRPKLVLPWGTSTILGHLLMRWRSLAAAQIACVCAPDNAQLDAELDRLEWPASLRIINPAPERGMFSSVQCAAHWTGWQPGLTHWAIALGDQPLVRIETMRQLLEFAIRHPAAVCQPGRHGRGRHPVILPAATFAQLQSCAAADLKEFLVMGSWPLARFESDDTGLDSDLDEPGDYDRALAQATATP